MKVRHRYTFRNDSDNKEIINFLEKNNVKYETSSGIPLVTVEVFNIQSYWFELNEMMNKHGKNSIAEMVFTKAEIKKAEWLRIRSKWRWEYPQPELLYEEKTYDNSNYCSECGNGLIQKEEFRIKKEPKWGKKNFLMLNWIEDELFVNASIVNKFYEHKISGISFMDVKNVKTDNVLSNIKQLKVDTILEKGMLLQQEDIKEKIVCCKCKKEKFILTGCSQLKFRKEIFSKAPDIVKTNEIFGGGLIAAREIIISNKVANMILKNKWSSNLVLEPIELI